MNSRFNFVFLILFLMMYGCSRPPQVYEGRPEYQIMTDKGEPNYSDLHFWAAHPYKQDASDSVPKPLRTNYSKDSSVDVFFIHPTTYTSPEKTFGPNADLASAALNGKTDYSTILYQASIFNQAGRVFAPRYRQAHLSSYFPRNREDSMEAMKAFELAYQDVKTAFQYYLEHFNTGRPIVIASHSQGSTHAKRLLKEFFDHQTLQKQLVVAYVVGMVYNPKELGSIPVCKTPAETGCVCAWRTFKNEYTPPFVEREHFQSIVTNPLTWDAGQTHADRDQNKGGILLRFNKLVPRVADATVADKVLWTGKPHFFGSLFYTSKNYHVADMNLYYLSIRENVALRISAFRKK